MAIVYQHTRKDNGNVFYIGIGKEEKRAYVRNGKQRNPHWHRIVNKYGYDIKITHKDICWEEACKIEQYLIAFWREALGERNITNLTDGGDGILGLKMSNEAKQKMRLKKLGTKQSEEVKKKRGESISRALQSPEVKARYSAASTGRWHTDQAKDKISKARTGGGNGKARKVIDTVTGEIFDCMKDAANKCGIPCGTLQHYLTGYCKNKTNLKYLV
jgi:hypothetical protein